MKHLIKEIICSLFEFFCVDDDVPTPDVPTPKEKKTIVKVDGLTYRIFVEPVVNGTTYFINVYYTSDYALVESEWPDDTIIFFQHDNGFYVEVEAYDLEGEDAEVTVRSEQIGETP